MHLVCILALGREQDYGNVAFFPERRCCGESVESGHHNVQKRKMHRFAGNDVKRLPAAVGFKRMVAFRSQVDFQSGHDIAVVVTDEDVVHACSPLLVCTLIVSRRRLNA